ncbi:hypothetical protein K437DRAFT_253794 [Tilletiaria anomala UBC 951]|uniref:uS12 prolyl 3,4-dihydroxylase n=1 Tax=Tilletiaria anomala (strain ATCC 24038 / CBS 436.72 / UBC 951) TaxID=1037660 RepID=A0A066WPF3_TILAU|nr:uncharacterized protein K437DRAFT_253794 [Tilletiaria anomala UBC 951]KDN52854.1 hypothetical protein K437DRAFT_253794 [Tilletiaria anomala UBC 951]
MTAPNGGAAVPTDEQVKSFFAPDLLSESTVASHASQYAASGPYKHGVIPALLSDSLLREARKEIVEELRFAEKETDIYKVHQTGDLANLDGLPDEERDRLKHVLNVRNAIYSKQFRDWLQKVTGCGPLSAKKKDMSINDYRDGCHLLNHDDVISTRQLSYILYLPDPSVPWRSENGGALELYPVLSPHLPDSVPTKSIPPAWNQYTFFTVQPGHSFHSVEEVVHPTASRLSISGWFHRPQEGEEGYDAAQEEKQERMRKEHSSVESLLSKQAARPFIPYSGQGEDASEGNDDMIVPGSPLSQQDKAFLSYFLNPAYLQHKVQSQLFEQFGDDSHILLADFLKREFKDLLQKGLVELDRRDGFRWWEAPSEEDKDIREQCKLRPHGIGTGKVGGETGEDWKIQGPPHRHRFLSLCPSTPASPSASSLLPPRNPALPVTPPQTAEALLSLLRSTLFPSPAFRHFLANITQLLPLAARAPFTVRRFRPGLDYTLARADEDEAVLHITLGLTPDVADSVELAAAAASGSKGKVRGMAAKRGKLPGTAHSAVSAAPLSKKQLKDLRIRWESGEAGGWECFMAPHEGEEDPAVYRSGGSKKAEAETEGKDEDGADAEMADGDDEEEEIVEMEEDTDSDFDGVLLNLTPQFNALNVALRDEGVLHFVKYLSGSAGGSRWDVEGEWSVGALEVEEGDGEVAE